MEIQTMKHTTEDIESYIKENIKGKFSSSYNPNTNLWFRKLSNDHYIGGDNHIVCHIQDVNGITFSKTLLQIKGK